MKLSGRTILITGGASGIGLEFAKQLLGRGNVVVVTGRDQAKLQQAKQSLRGLHTFQSDVGKPEEIEALREQVLKEFPKLDTLINNAGIMRKLDLNTPHDLPDLTQEIDTNLSGPIQMVEAFLPQLKSCKQSLILNVSSGLAFVPFPASPIYSAAKAGLHAYTRCLRMQLKGSSVEVVELAPPPVETALFRGEFEEHNRHQSAMAPSDLVKTTLAEIEAGSFEIRPGISRMFNLMSRLAPQLIFNQMTKMSKLNH